MDDFHLPLIAALPQNARMCYCKTSNMYATVSLRIAYCVFSTLPKWALGNSTIDVFACFNELDWADASPTIFAEPTNSIQKPARGTALLPPLWQSYDLNESWS
jgi:hypothetical protein